MANGYVTNMPLDSAINMLDKGVQSALKAAIKEKLMASAEVIVEEIANNMANNIKASLKHYEHLPTGEVQIAIIIDGVKKGIDS